MAFEMVDRDQRLACGMRQRLAGDEADHDAADQPRSGGRGDRIDVVQAQPALHQRLFDQRHQPVDMRARGDFGDDAAIGRMAVGLPGERLRQYPPVGCDQRRCGFVAARFYPEDDGHAVGNCSVRSPLTAPFPPPASLG